LTYSTARSEAGGAIIEGGVWADDPNGLCSLDGSELEVAGRIPTVYHGKAGCRKPTVKLVTVSADTGTTGNVKFKSAK